ncbi:LysR substrate-binding domain-containing protein [Devosia sp. 1566]|uniref:LysR family transcriptional regulator n=1 Tax=Devosia sp. 1566 TaxID=2499144 RepID=UPI000FD7FEF3|nr:LysR substrate-binding domain-containing protein [Devosia sp. 1566]
MEKIFSEHANISVRHYRAVLAVAEERSFSAAAARLRIAISAVTQAVQQVEQHAGTLLFDRSTRPVRLTPAGERFADECRHLLSIHGRALRDLQLAGDQGGSEIAVAGAPSLIKTLLLPAIREFRLVHPRIRIAVSDDVAGRIEARILEREVDFAVASRWQPTAELVAEEIGRDEVCLVCSRDNPLARLRQVDFGMLEGETIISLMAETGISRLLESSPMFPRQLLTGQLKAFSTIAQLMMVEQNLGVAFLPRLAATALGDDRLAFLPVKSLSIWRPLHLLTSRRNPISPMADALCAIVRQHTAGLVV